MEVQLEEFVKELTKTIKEVCPGATCSVSGNRFAARYATEWLPGWVDGPTYQGKVDVERPTDKGFRLRIILGEGKYIEQDQENPRPKEYLRPNRKNASIFFDAVTTADEKHHYTISFWYGDQLDSKVKETIRAALQKLHLNGQP